MLACYAWSNLQLINITNAAANIYVGERADLFVRVGPHISNTLIKSIEDSGVFDHVHCIDPLTIDVSRERGGKIRGIRIFALKHAYAFAYSALLERLCGEQKYDRVLLPWFFADSVYLLKYWAKFSQKLAITFVEEGTSSYYYTKKQMCYSLFNAPTIRAKLKRFLMEGHLMRKFSKYVDTICLYKPDYCSEDIDFEKRSLPIIQESNNPIMYNVLIGAASDLDYTHFMRYDRKSLYYFSSYNLADPAFEQQGEKLLNIIIKNSHANSVLCKVHTHATSHAKRFASSMEGQIFVDRERYIFEGLFTQLPQQDQKVIISCASTTATNPKFMFGVEPYVIFTYRLYNDYRQRPVECDDLISGMLLDSYENKEKVMIPNSIYELESMVRQTYNDITSI